MFFKTSNGMHPAPLKHNPLNALICPRPIAWVSTVSAQGEFNLAPFSYFNAVSADPPCVMFAPNGNAPGSAKDTYRNIGEVPEFVVNLVGESQAQAMNETSAAFEHGIDEFAVCGIEHTASQTVRPPRVRLSKAALECRVLQTIDLPSGKQQCKSHVVIGEVVAIYIDDEIIVDGVVDERRLAPLARLGAFNYANLGEIVEIARPK